MQKKKTDQQVAARSRIVNESVAANAAVRSKIAQCFW